VLPLDLLERLADGGEVSRASLRELLMLDEATLETQLAELRAAGLELIGSGRDSVRLAEPIDWLDPAALRAALAPDAGASIESLDCVRETASTNRDLLEQGPPGPGMARIVTAEYQTAGRGRRGRGWTMPPGAGLALSVSWRFEPRPATLSALSLAVGAAARRAIFDATGLDVALKWPNDLFVDGGKLGGILVEISDVADGACHVVAGIGINVRFPATCLASVSNYAHGARDLAGAQSAGVVERTGLAARLIERLIELYSDYAATGFAGYAGEWQAAHVLDGQLVTIHAAGGRSEGRVIGIAADGALLVESAAGEAERIISGDVTIRVGADVCD